MLLGMASTVIRNGIDCCWEWHRLLLGMASTVVGNGIDRALIAKDPHTAHGSEGAILFN